MNSQLLTLPHEREAESKESWKKNLKESLWDLVTARSGEWMLLFTKCIQAEALLVSTAL